MRSQRFALVIPPSHDRGRSCAADLTVDGSGGHWAYVSLSNHSLGKSDAACPLSPLPEHASDGTCAGDAIPHGSNCAPHCDYMWAVRGSAMATCKTSGLVSLGLWKGMCGALIDSNNLTWLWDIICGTVTGVTVLCVPCIVRNFKRDLQKELTAETSLVLPAGEDALGWVGVTMFVVGFGDLVLDISLCLALYSCEKEYLLLACVTTLVVTMTVTIYLGFHTLNAIREGNDRAGDWWIKNGTAASLIIIASSSRVESLAILRLRLCGRMISDFPMAHEVFHFLRYEGSYHYFLEDGPHLLIAVALLVTSDPNSDICGEEHKWLPASLRPSHDTARLFAVLNIAHTCWSIFYGCVSKTGQRVARNRPRQGPLERVRSSIVEAVESLRMGSNTLGSADRRAEPQPELEAPLLDAAGGDGMKQREPEPGPEPEAELSGAE